MISRLTPDFNEERMYEMVEKYSFPRLVGSEGEARARELVIADLEALDLPPIVEPFSFSTHFANFIVRGSIGLVGLFFLLYILKDFIPLLSGVFLYYGIGFGLYCPFMVYFLKNPAKTRPQNLKSANIYSKIPAKGVKQGIVVLSAHYDTKSQRISVWARCIFSLLLLLVGVFGTAAIVSFEVLAALGRPVTPISEWILRVALGVGVISAGFLALNKIENESVGSVDNAAGMAIVFELARWVKKYPLDKYEVWVVQFGAEELGTMGSRFFLEKHIPELKDGLESFDLNFDMIDDRVQYLRTRGMFPPKAMCKNLGLAFERAAHEQDIPWSKYSLIIGASSDQKMFFQQGIEAIDFQDRSGAKWAHSKNDTPDKVNPVLLRQSCEIAYQIIRQIDAQNLEKRPPYWKRVKSATQQK